jgi:hypothetical protein
MMNRRRHHRFLIPACLGIIFFLCVCQKKSQDKIPISNDSEPVTLTFEVYNHTQGFLTDFKMTQEQGAPVTIHLNDLEVDGVDKNRMVIREDRFGKRVAFTQTEMATFHAPSRDKNYTLFLMNASNGADYRKVDTWINTNEGVLEYVPPLKWYREDRNDYQGPEDVIQDAIDQLNDALDYSWVKYGSLQRIVQRENSSFGVGYGYCRNQFGWHNPYWAGVNPDHCLTYKMKLATFLEEIFELVTRLNDIGGKDTAALIADPDTGSLNDVGKDLLAYVFVKDEKIRK